MGKRANFTNIQLQHYVPVKNYEVSRVRTGFEKVIAYRTRIPFAYTAKDDGKIIDINNTLKLVKIKYKNGDVEVVEFGEINSYNSSEGYYIAQTIELNPKLKKGQSVKKDDLICYHRDYFDLDPVTGDINWKHGVNAVVAFLDDDKTVEDSSAISKRLADKLGFHPVYKKEIVLTKDTNIYQIAMPGTEVDVNDILMTFDQDEIPESMKNDEDTEYMKLITKLNRATPKSKYAGTITDIDVFYKCDLNDMSESLRKVVKAILKRKELKSKYAKGTNQEYKYPKPDKIEHSTRLGTINLDEGVVVFRFYIKTLEEMNAGSKIVFATSLKSVTCSINEDPIYTEDNSLEIDAFMSARSVDARIILDPYLVGVLNRILIDTEKKITDMYFK